MSVSVEELGPGPNKGEKLLAITSPSRRVEGSLYFLPTNPRTPEFIADKRLAPDESAAIDAWLKSRFPSGEFAPTESRLAPGAME